MIWLNVIILILFFLWKYVKSRERMWKLASRFPGPPGYPIIGNAFVFIGSTQRITSKLLSLMYKYDKLIKLWVGPSLLFMVYDIKYTKKILKEANYTDKADEYKFWRPIVGESLFTISGGPKFKRNKKLIMPSFQLNNLKGFFESFNKQSFELVERLKNKVGKEFDIGPDISICSMNVLLETVLGYTKEDLQKNAEIIVNATASVVQVSIERVYKFWMRPDFLFKLSSRKRDQDKYIKILNDITDAVIKYRRANKNNDTEKNWSVFIDSLIEARDDVDGSCLTDRDISNEILTFLFAGQDTTSLSVGYTLCLLGLHKVEQEKLYDEIIKVTGDSNSFITYEQLNRMDYLNRVVQESWRLFPPAPAVAKKVLKDIELDENLVIPKDSAVAVILHFVHRDKENFPNPEKFNPDNFLPEKVNARDPYSYIPFSSGYRTCVGQKYGQLLVRVMVAAVIRAFKVHSTIPPREYKLSYETTMQRKDGFRLTLEQRQN